MNYNELWIQELDQVIRTFLEYLNKQTDRYVLKGGTALYLCYSLDRFSEDIDLDGSRDRYGLDDRAENIVRAYCNSYGYTYRIAKDTPSVKRFFIHYQEEDAIKTPLKVEISYRERANSFVPTVVDGIRTYDLNTLFAMKKGAYESRDTLRDLYDISFLCAMYWDKLSESNRLSIADTFQRKGFEHFDYIIHLDDDPLIDKNRLTDRFLRAMQLSGLIDERTNEFDKDEHIR